MAEFSYSPYKGKYWSARIATLILNLYTEGSSAINPLINDGNNHG